MPRVTFTSLAESDERTVEAAPNQSLMLAAKANRIAGIEAVCGGSMACGTCHVHVDPDWFDRLPPPSEGEREVLEYAVDPTPTSRLSCQIVLTEALDGLKVAVPASQF